MAKTYDRRCYDLAAIFLGDEPDLHNEANIHALALEIQQTIEDEIEFMRSSGCQGHYGKMCRDPKICAGKGPRDPNCAD